LAGFQPTGAVGRCVAWMTHLVPKVHGKVVMTLVFYYCHVLLALDK
jgi:hypothetical protein